VESLRGLEPAHWCKPHQRPPERFRHDPHCLHSGPFAPALIEGRENRVCSTWREEGPYFAAVIRLFAVSLPLSRLELKVLDLVPRFDAPIVSLR